VGDETPTFLSYSPVVNTYIGGTHIYLESQSDGSLVSLVTSAEVHNK